MYKFILLLIIAISYTSGNYVEEISEAHSSQGSSNPDEVNSISGVSTTALPDQASTMRGGISVDPNLTRSEQGSNAQIRDTTRTETTSDQTTTAVPLLRLSDTLWSNGTHAFEIVPRPTIQENSSPAVSEPTTTTQPSTQEPLVEESTVSLTPKKVRMPFDPIEDEQNSNVKIGEIIYRDVNTTTFIASNQTAVRVNSTNWTNGTQYSHVVQLSPEFNINKYELVRGSMIVPSNILPSHGFVHTVISSYKDHHNLVIRPDDIWTAILVQFSRYVNANAEELRHHFVSHTGQKTITLNLGSLMGRTGGQLTLNEWKKCLTHLYNEVDQLSNRNLTWFVHNNFTTTKTADRMVSHIVFLSAMQHYFKYDIAVYCGIPKITILGQTSDWLKIRERVEFIKTFGPIPTKWSELLLPIIDQFIAAKNGDVDGRFWSDMVRIQTNEVCAGTEQESILDGWITTFSVFDRLGVWRGEKYMDNPWPKINMKYVPSGVVRVPVNVKTKSGSGVALEEATLFAGHMGHHISTDRKGLHPYAGWAVAVKKAA